MTTDRIERRLPEILTEISLPQVPDYFDEILSQTARTRQRPGWTLLERWLPVDITVAPVRAGPMPLRTVGMVALLLIALAAAALYIGSRPRHAPFFGPAANGSIVYSRYGDIYVADADGSHDRLLVGGTDYDSTAGWSNDGSTLFFGRAVAGGTAVMAADQDGRGVRQASSTLVRAWESLSLSPDGTELAAINANGGPRTLGIHGLAGDGRYRELQLGAVEPTAFVAWRPPTGDEIVFLGHPGGIATDLALYTVHPDGSGLRPLAMRHDESIGSVATQLSFQGITLSDDGTTAAYWNWEPGARPDRDCSVYLIDLTTGREQRMTYDPLARCEMGPTFLGGGRILLERQDPAAGLGQLLVAPIDGTAPGALIGPTFRVSGRAGWILSPDRTEVLFRTPSGDSQLISIASGSARDIPIVLSDDLSWQRLAP